MDFELQFDPEEHYRAQIAMNRLLGYGKLTPIFAFGIPFLFSGVPILIGLAGSARIDWANANLWAWVLFPALWYGAIPALTKWQIRRAAGTEPTLRGTLTRAFSDEAIEARASGLTTRVAWSAVTRVEETREFLLFFYAKKLAIYVPKRILGSRLPDLKTYITDRMSRAGRSNWSHLGAV